MLVLSRGKNDKIVFPTLDISIEIMRISGSRVRVGIDAPKKVPVIRDELSDEWHSGFDTVESEDARHSQLDHEARNRLNAATLGLHLIQRKVELGETADLETDVFRVLNELKAIEGDGHVDEDSRGTPKATTRALVVEDDDNERELLSGFLHMNGYDVSAAVDGLQAMVHLSKHERPDIVLLDMNMPRFDGRKTVAAIRENPDYRGLKVFAVSGANRNEVDVTVGPRGVDRWFAKPLDPRTLLTAIEEEMQAAALSA